MKFNLPDEVISITKIFQDNGFEIYIVGGAVRDLLMGKIVYDWDLTTNATPEEMLEFLKKEDAYYTNDFGMVGVPSITEGERPYEITTYRTEHGYSDSRRPDNVAWGKSLEEDLTRRDFTINAMAFKIDEIEKLKNEKSNSYLLTLCDLTLIDHFDGQKDLQKKLVRAVGDPNERFSEDALRMIRAVRIASELGFTIEENTLTAIQNNCSLINRIAKERVRDELFKIFKSPFPYEGMLIFKNVGLMNEILPEMEKTFGVEQKSPGRHHIYDVGTHSMMSLKHVSEKTDDPLVRFATMMHDVGKAQTYRKDEKGKITFYNHELVSARIAKRVAERLRFSNKQSEKFYKLIRYHQFTVDENQSDSAIRRFINKVGIEYVPDMLTLRVGDRLGGGANETSWRLEEFKKRLIEIQKQPFTIRDIKISGHDVMNELNLKPGPSIGKILQKIFEEVVNNKIPNEKAALVAQIRQINKNQQK